LDPSDIAILRTHKITWGGIMGGFTTFAIQGSEEHPEFVISDETIVGLDDVPVTGSPEVVVAYKRMKEVANKVGLRSEGVWLDGGDVLIFNQKKVAHGRTPYTAKFDGTDRWMQRCYTNNGSFWQPSRLAEWPNRSLNHFVGSAFDQKRS
jgi:Zn-finger nucleic acid-binding protein